MDGLIRDELSPLEEAELKVETLNMYRAGGTLNVLAAVSMMFKCQQVILEKLDEILEEERGHREP